MANMTMAATNNSGDPSDKLRKNPIHSDVYSITHDLRAPLNSIRGLINLLKSDLEKTQVDEYLHFLERSVDKMDESISRIIESSKENKELEVQTEEINFTKLIDESLFSLRYMEDARLVHITVSIQESGLFLSDYSRLLSIFNNMISNAIRYRDPAKNSLLQIDVFFEKGVAVITFTDNGIGIDEPFQSKIFDKLFRVNDDQRGSGLGLHIVDKTIKKLRGEIVLQSQLGVGTSFILQIPNTLSNSLRILCD